MPVLNREATADAIRYTCDRCGYTGPGFPDGACSDYSLDRENHAYCPACSKARDLERMDREGILTAYVSGDGAKVTTFKGDALATVNALDLIRRSTVGGWDVYALRARDDKGRIWVGRGGGRGMYCNLKLAKRQPAGVPA